MKYRDYKIALKVYLNFIFILIGIVLVMGYFVLSLLVIRTPEGEWVRSNWQKEFTKDLKEKIVFIDNQPKLNEEALKLIKDKKVSLQILDEVGSELFTYNNKEQLPTDYSSAMLLNLSKEDNIYIESIKNQEREWICILRFPKSIAKVTMYLNAKVFTSGRSLSFILIGCSLVIILIGAFVYGYFWMQNMKNIIIAIEDIGKRNYLPIYKRNNFEGVYKQLNHLEDTIRKSEAMTRQTEDLRKEWIANITHDLKTPLTPIRGYAEMILQSTDTLSQNEMKQYAQIMLNNISYSEALIGDLKLTYQLDSGVIVLNKRKDNIVRFLKEVVIDLLNSPDYSERQIEFESQKQEIMMEYDKVFLRRAFNNLILNSLVHNKQDTKVKLNISETKRQVLVIVSDDGKGMTEEEIVHLFERYYRGVSTKQKAEGTGLGMAIAKQIIEMHKGKIEVISEKGKGTQFIIRFDKN